MSKIGKINIAIPEKVKIILNGNLLNVEGPLEKFGFLGLVLGFSINIIFLGIFLFEKTYHYFFYIYFLELKKINFLL